MPRCFRFALFLQLLIPLTASAEWSVSGYVGKTWTQNAEVRVVPAPGSNIVLKDLHFDDRSFRGPIYYGARGGYMFTRSLGIEGEFIHSKVFARLPQEVGGLVQQYNVSHGLNLLFGNFVMRRPVVRPLTVAARAGLGVAVPHPEIRAFGESLNEYERQGAAVQLAGGAEFELTRRLFWMGEYKFTLTKPRFEVGSGRIENTFSTHHVVTGLCVHF